jgi:hypothetical protein
MLHGEICEKIRDIRRHVTDPLTKKVEGDKGVTHSFFICKKPHLVP